MKPWPPELGVQTVELYSARARLLRAEARSEMLRLLFRAVFNFSARPRASGDPGQSVRGGASGPGFPLTRE